MPRFTRCQRQRKLIGQWSAQVENVRPSGDLLTLFNTTIQLSYIANAIANFKKMTLWSARTSVKSLCSEVKPITVVPYDVNQNAFSRSVAAEDMFLI